MFGEALRRLAATIPAKNIWLIVTPGIRPGAAAAGDQVRLATPEAARRAGADYVVVGRPITGAPDPAAAASAIVAELGRVPA